MPPIESVFRQWRARLRTLTGHGRSGWIVWLIVALICVQMWGLQHEILHARELSGSLRSASAPVDSHASDLTFGDDDDVSSTTPFGAGGHHHHCHLFEGATLAAAMAVAVLQWHGANATATTPLRATGRTHASALELPFDSRAPPVAV